MRFVSCQIEHYQVYHETASTAQQLLLNMTFLIQVQFIMYIQFTKFSETHASQSKGEKRYHG